MDDDTSKKFDYGKPRLDLIPGSALIAAAEVFAFGATKYGEHNWRKTQDTPAWGRVYASIQRHMTAFWEGEDIDPESGLSHLHHALTQTMMLVEYTQTRKDLDSRWATRHKFAVAAATRLSPTILPPTIVQTDVED